MARIAPCAPRLDRSASPTVQRPPALPDCNFMQLLGNSPAATAAYLACEEALGRGQLPVRQRESLALAVAEMNGAGYCLAAHCARARKAGLSEEEIRAARKASAADPQTHALLQFALAVTLQRGEVSDADFRALRRAGFEDAQIAEIIAGIALNIFTNYFNGVARTELDFPPPPGRDSR